MHVCADISFEIPVLLPSLVLCITLGEAGVCGSEVTHSDVTEPQVHLVYIKARSDKLCVFPVDES